MWLVAVVGRCVVGCEHCEPSHCSHPTTQRPTTATNHIQQNQRNTPLAVTHGLCSPEDGHNDAWKHVETEVDDKHLIVAYCWFSLSSQVFKMLLF